MRPVECIKGEYLMLQPRLLDPSTFDETYRNYKESVYSASDVAEKKCDFSHTAFSLALCCINNDRAFIQV